MTRKQNDEAIAKERAHREAQITARHEAARPKQAGVRVQRVDMPRLLDLAKKLGAALDYQNEAWGLYGDKSKAALREWKEWEARGITRS